MPATNSLANRVAPAPVPILSWEQCCGSGKGYVGLCCLAQSFIVHATCDKQHPTKLALVAINLIASHLQLTSEGSLCHIV